MTAVLKHMLMEICTFGILPVLHAEKPITWANDPIKFNNFVIVIYHLCVYLIVNNGLKGTHFLKNCSISK